jgi:hypothetical protein
MSPSLFRATLASPAPSSSSVMTLLASTVSRHVMLTVTLSGIAMHPRLATSVSALACASSSVRYDHPLKAPDSSTALWYRWKLPGIERWAVTAAAPADSPQRTTLFGSPPKASMLSCTHCSTARWSSEP